MGSLKAVSPDLHFSRIELKHGADNSPGKSYVIQNSEAQQYLEASEYINLSDIAIADIQHEFKIFGKPDGENISILLNHIRKPVVTTLHTVSRNLNEPREKVFREIVKRSDLLFVFSKEAKDHLKGRYSKQGSRIEVIPHGVPLIEYKKPAQVPERKKFTGKPIFVSAGHMRNTKGYELAITALHSLKKEIPDFQYLILGSNHPENETAQSYRETLSALVKKLNLTGQVIFISEYLELNDLIKYIQSADICLLPYTRKDQSSSGVLALMLACGRPVVSTPFQFATSFLSELSGTISTSFCAAGFEAAMRILINKSNRWDRMAQFNHALGQNWNWGKVANQYSLGYKKLLSQKC
jgi:glycosyltransferase involved in cell wall biosynthesis